MNAKEKLSKKSINTINGLKNKIERKGRMPGLKQISDLLIELKIKHSLNEYWTRKYNSPSGCRYYTSGGNREYNGYDLKIPSINLNINSTDTYYSWNSWRYANKIYDLILKTKNEENERKRKTI